MYPDYKPTERDWVKDFTHENGNYNNKCIECDLWFIGHKRRIICFKCANTEKIIYEVKK